MAQRFTRIAGSPVENLGVVRDGFIYRSAQPSREGYEWLKKELNLSVSMNLRLTSEEAVLKDLKIVNIEVPIDTLKIGLIEGLTNEKIDTILKQLTSSYPILVHCRQGHDRTGTIVACYRMQYQGWSFKEAFEECCNYGFNPVWFKLRSTIENYSYYLQGK